MADKGHFYKINSVSTMQGYVHEQNINTSISASIIANLKALSNSMLAMYIYIV